MNGNGRTIGETGSFALPENIAAFPKDNHMTLPITPFRDEIKRQLACHSSLIVTAPPGTGKSTQIPQFLFEECSPDRQLYVLEPRRIAARTLAYRVAEERGGLCGGEVGYQVRFERKVSSTTRIVFLTYGTFLQLLISDPSVSRTSIIIFDEFHERTLESDVALAWVRRLITTNRPDLKLMVLSATLDPEPLAAYLPASTVIDIPHRSFPVDIRYQPSKALERLDEQVERAFSGLPGQENGSVLVFLPGVYEIERAVERLSDAARRRGFRICTLHGKMNVPDQQEVLRLPSNEPCVILSTNVAETSLTIPGVTAVIDSGLARVASYDPERDRNTLYVNRISLQNAAQRAGRAGRLGPGICIRLWSRDDERAMPPAIIPEIMRLDLAKSMLALGRLANSAAPITLRWLTPPPDERWEKAAEELVRCEAIESVARKLNCTDPHAASIPPITGFGRAMSALPVEPAVAALLLKSSDRQERAMNIAMAAIWENGESPGSNGVDLFVLAGEFLSDEKSQRWGREVRETRDQLERLLREEVAETGSVVPSDSPELLKVKVSKRWMRLFSHRIAAQTADGALYTLQDGRTVKLSLKKKVDGKTDAFPAMILALSIHERGGKGQSRQIAVPLYLPLEIGWIEEEFPGKFSTEIEGRWDEARSRVIVESVTRFGTVICKREPVEGRREGREVAASFLAEKLTEGIWNWRFDEPRAEQYLFRMKLAAKTFPDLGIPSMNGDDWALVFHELSEGNVTLDEVKKGSMLHALQTYVGAHLHQCLERKAPEFIILPTGKKGRITYFDEAAPEISARLGDFIGYRDRFLLLDGRVQGIFNILAPNYRTVQKTADLGSFWKNTYPSIKNELKRRYPKHPWP
jgi:ATP-dependent helicase HrpB